MEPLIEFIPDLNCLYIRLEGKINPSSFIKVYDQVLSHELFEKGMHLVWNATNAQIKDITLVQSKKVFDHVKANESKRGKSYSAWVFARGENYETACLFKAAFASKISINYEAFNNVNEAFDWIRSARNRDLGNTYII